MENCKCNKRFDEYGSCVRGVVRHVAPSCKGTAVIPSVTVEKVEGLVGLADCFVHVASINTTYYIDNKGQKIIMGNGPVEIDNYDYKNNPRNLRSQTVYDFANSRGIYYNSIGAYRLFSLAMEEE